MVKIIDPYKPAVEVNGKVLTPESETATAQEKEIVNLLREARKRVPFGRSITLFSLSLHAALKDIVEREGD